MKKILIIGKSGLIGKRISEIITDNNLNYDVYSGSRHVSNDLQHFQIDVCRKDTLSRLKEASIDLVVLCTNDKENNVLQYCIQNSIDYLDITKPTPDLREAYTITNSVNCINSRIVFASGWMGGIIGGLVPKNINLQELKLYIYYSLEDISGKSSVDFLAENITSPFAFYVNDQQKRVRYFQDPERHKFNFGLGLKKVYNFDLPDLYILNKSRGVPSVSAKITYNSALVTSVIRTCLSLRVFSALSTDTMKKIFRSTGKGDKTSFDISYTLNEGREKYISIECTKGQAELTSFATVLNIQKLFTKERGIYFAHEIYDNLELYDLLKKNKYINIK